jgi:hypothetical protein
MMETVSPGVAVKHFGLGHAGTDGIAGYDAVIIAFFLIRLAAHTDRFVIVYRQNPRVVGLQCGVAAMTSQGTCQFFFPLIHANPSFHWYWLRWSIINPKLFDFNTMAAIPAIWGRIGGPPAALPRGTFVQRSNPH